MSFLEEISLRADDKATPGIDRVAGSIRSLIRELGALAGISVGIAGIAQLVRTGVEFNAMLEDSKIGIAGVIGSLHTFSGATGEALRGEAAWQAALRTSVGVQEQLKTAALTTTATYGEMVEAFQVGVGPMTRAGIALMDTAEATQRLTQVAAAASIPMAQLAVEIRQFFNGDVMRGRLLQTLQITKDQIEQHKRLGDMMEFIRQKTESYARAAQAAAESMTGRVSNLKDAVQQVLGAGLQPFYEQVKKSLGDITAQFVTFGRDAKGNLTAQFSQELVSRVRAFGDALSVILAKLTPLLATSVAFVASILGAGAKAAAALSPLLDVLTGILGFLTKVSDSVGTWAIGVWAVAKAFGAVEAAAKAAMVASAAAKAFGGGGGAAAAGTAAGTAAGAGAGAGLLATSAGAATAGVALVAAGLAYLGSQIAKEIGDKVGVMFDSRVKGQRAWYDTRSDGQVLDDAQRGDVSSVLGMAQIRAALKGNSDLARSIGEVAKAYDSQNITADEAVKKLRALSQAGRDAFKANQQAADPTVLQKYSDAIEKIRGQITALGQTGLTAALTKSKTDYVGDIAALRNAMGEATTEDEKKKIREQQDARIDLWNAEKAKAYRDYRNELAKQRLELAKENAAIAQTWLEGGAREVAAIYSKTADTVAALEQEREQVAQTDGLAAEKIKLYSARIKQALERRGADLAEWARAAWDKYRDVEIQAQQTILEAQGKSFEAGMLGLSERYRKAIKAAEDDLAGAREAGDSGAVKQILDAIARLHEASAAETDRLARENRLRLAEVRGDWREMAKDIEDRVRRGALNARDALRELGDNMVRFGKSYSDGALGALNRIMADIPTQAESAAAAVNGVWSGMTRAFDDLFFNVLSGRVSSLKDVFKNLWQSLLQTFSRFLSDMVQRWIKSQIEMSQTGYTGKAFNVTSYGPNGEVSTASGAGTSSGGGAKPGVWGYLGAAGTGYGLGGSIGPGGAGNQWGGAIGAVGGLALGSTAGVIAGVGSAIGLGAAAGSVVPIIGTIVGALIGAIIGGLFNKSTERSVEGSLGAMAGATKWDWIPGYTRTNRRTGEETEVPGRWEGTVQRPTTAFERQGERLLQTQAASLSDLFRVGAKDQARELMASYQTALKESLSGAWFKISAGSTEDIEKDAEYVLKSLLPRIGLAAAFGQTGYLPSGDRNAPGGIPGVNWGMPGMDTSGAWTGAKQLFDPEAPIPKMLEGLGFTAERISELAGRISTDDPEKLLAYLKGVVGVVVGLRDLGTEMAKTFGDLTKEWADEAAAGPAAAFGKRATELATQFGDLSLYSGDEQVQKAQEALAASNEFWESVKSYLQQLQALQEKLSAGLQGMREKMRSFLNPLSEGGQMAADQLTVDETWGKLLAAKTPAEIEAATNGAAAAIERMFSVLAERVNRGKALLDKSWDLLNRLGNLAKDVAFDELLQANPLKAWGQQMEEMQKQLARASSMSGLEQIAALEDVNASAEQMYQNLRGFLNDIASVTKSINQSIDSQIWELGVGEMDAQGQAGAITQRIQQLQEQLKLATSPAEIAAITSEIQGLTNRYIGTFGQDDPNRQAAIDWARQELERTRGLANEALNAMRDQAKAFATELEGIIRGSTTTLSTNVDEATTAIGQLSQTLGELDKAVQGAITRLGDETLDALGPLRAAFDEAKGIFTSATGDAAYSLTGPDGFNAGLADSTEALGGFEGALRRAAGALKQIGYGPEDGTEKSTQKASTSARASSAQILSTVRRSRAFLTPRVA